MSPHSAHVGSAALVKKHKVSTGPKLHLCACIIGGRVRVLHYLLKRWCGKAAEDLYRNVIGPALRRHCGARRTYTILEDNDPTGYKSKRAIKAKAELGIDPIQFPTYSPDLNPLDFALWDEVERRMNRSKASKNDSLEQFKARLRRTAMATPEDVVRKMLGDIKTRAQSIYDHDGGHIPKD